eukprot:gene38891-51126_t
MNVTSPPATPSISLPHTHSSVEHSAAVRKLPARRTSNETKNFNDVYYSSSALIASRIERNLERKLQAATVIDNIFSYAVMDGYIGKPPNITLPGFDDIMMSICALSTARGISVSPL